ncbi:hypothetical protein [Kitasatospora azatica]|uniref:hypothetical protein n=1 Tax=Kitasatospora azatica TaxID=58347 RepID=UPI00056044FE|nr:hypothetical protein [Kitasatospora azatica]
MIASEIARVLGGSGSGSSTTQWKYVVEYRVDGGEPQRVELKQVWGLLGKKMINPPTGHDVPLLLDTTSGKVRFDVDHPAINFKAIYKADKAKRDAEFRKKLNG